MLKTITHNLRKISDFFPAVLFVTIFCIFCINVISRYLFNESYGWIIEFSMILWVWVVFFTCAFTLRDDEHIAIHFVLERLSEKGQKICHTIAAICLFLFSSYMVLPTWDYIDFLSIRPSDVMGIPMKNIYIIFMAFLLSLIIRSLYKLYDLYIKK
ncbi:MAG: TRAP transporter small permease [Alphaproteobacteria bacterium]